MNGRYLFEIGMVLVVLLVLAAPAAADNILRIEPSEISCTPGEEVTNVRILLNATDPVTAFQVHLKYAGDVVDIVNVTHAEEIGTNPDWVSWDAYWKVDDGSGGDDHLYLFITGSLWFSEMTGDNIEIGSITLKGLSPGTQLLELDGWSPGHDPCQVVNIDGDILNLSVVHADFTVEGDIPSETFTKDLSPGWNLISLPLTPTDNSVSEVLSTVLQNGVTQYDATTHQFEDATTMDPGVGYFVNVTTACTWEYEGEAYTSMTASLSDGLNCVGWVNETGSALPGALSSIDGSYWYVSRWNANTQSYEVYNPTAPDGFNDFETMDRGEGYFISATDSCTLVYP